MTRLAISLMGEPRVTGPGGAVLGPLGPKAMAMLACLAADPDLRVGRARLVDLLWADAPSTSAARHALRQCLVRLRVQLGSGAAALGADEAAIWLRADRVSVDCRWIAHAARSGTDAEIVDASATIRGAFCAGLETRAPEFEDWLRTERDHHDRLCAAIFGRAAPILARRGETAAAIAAARRRLALEPFEAAAHADLIALCRRLGRPREASEAHSACHDLFRTELGILPGPDVEAALGVAMAPRRGSPAPRLPRPAQADIPRTTRGRLAVALSLSLLAVLALPDAIPDRPAAAPEPDPVRDRISLWVDPADAGTAGLAPMRAAVRTSAPSEGAHDDDQSAVRRMLDGDPDYAMLYPAGC